MKNASFFFNRLTFLPPYSSWLAHFLVHSCDVQSKKYNIIPAKPADVLANADVDTGLGSCCLQFHHISGCLFSRFKSMRGKWDKLQRSIAAELIEHHNRWTFLGKCIYWFSQGKIKVWHYMNHLNFYWENYVLRYRCFFGCNENIYHKKKNFLVMLYVKKQ